MTHHTREKKKRRTFPWMFVFCVGCLFLLLLIYTVTRVTSPPEQYFTTGSSGAILLQNLIASLEGKVRYTMDPRTGNLRFLAGADRPLSPASSGVSDPESTARKFLATYGILFGIADEKKELTLLKIENDRSINSFPTGMHSVQFGSFDPLARIHVRFRQIYNGVPVFGSQLLVHLRAMDYAVLSVNGSITPEISLDTNPAISAQQASIRAREEWQIRFGTVNPTTTNPTLYILDTSVMNPTSGGGIILVWEVEVTGFDSEDAPQGWKFYLDAQTGAKVGEVTSLRQLSRIIFDCMLIRGCPDWAAQTARKESDPETPIHSVNELYTYLGKSHDYFFSHFGRNGANGQGGTGDGSSLAVPLNSDTAATVVEDTYGFNYVNNPAVGTAYSDGEAVYIPYGKNTLDVVGHEYTHIVTENTADFMYKFQSGALDEAYADIFGALIDAKDWLMQFEDGEIFRNFSDLQPDRLFNDQYECGPDDDDHDHGGVHQNAAIIEHAAYLMSEGGNFNGCSIRGIGKEKMSQIYYRALSSCLTSNANFRDAYDCLTESCANLYGATSTECANVYRALWSVEADQQPPGVQTGAVCPGSSVVARSQACPVGNGNVPTSTPTPEPLPPNSPTPLPPGAPTLTPTRTPTPGGATPTRTPTPRPPTATPTPASTCRLMSNLRLTSTGGSDLGSQIPKGQDFLCKVATDQVNYTTICGLSVNGSWPADICRNYGGYGYQRWEGTTVVFKCNTKCAYSSSCQTDSVPSSGAFELVGFDFSSQCGPYKSTVVRKTVTIQ